MMDDIGCVLHIGAPKCGSSALQTALSRTPVLRDGAGRQYGYAAYREAGGQARVLQGRMLTMARRYSPYGYLCWPNVAAAPSDDRIWAAMRTVLRNGHRRGVVPILSNEGWIGQADRFAQNLLAAEGFRLPAPAAVVAFVRPPLDWLNAAYWQWGVWSGLDIDTWLARPSGAYRLGAQLALWARLPGIRLAVRPGYTDVVQGFADTFGLRMPAGATSNAALPAALIGFLLRNRRFRPTPHDARSAFVFQRWCDVAGAARPWALQARHLPLIAADMAADVARLMAAIASADAAVLQRDPRWHDAAPYHDRLEVAATALDDRAGLAALYVALSDGVTAAARAAGRRPLPLAVCPAASADLAVWDTALADGLTALIGLDEAARLGRLRGALWQAGGALWRRGGFGDGGVDDIMADRPGPPGAGTGAAPAPAPPGPITDLAEAEPVLDAIAAVFAPPVFPSTAPLRFSGATQQSGGGLLCAHLVGTGRVAGGSDVLEPAQIARTLKAAPAPDLAAYLAGLVRRAPPDTRALCLLASWQQLVGLYRWNLPAMFAACHLIHVARRDHVAQAAALHLVLQVQGLTPAARAAAPPVYDRARIAAIIARQRRDDTMIATLAAAMGQPTIALDHDQIATRPTVPLRRLMRLCGAAPDTWTAPAPQGPANPTVTDFAARYRADLRRRVLTPPGFGAT